MPEDPKSTAAKMTDYVHQANSLERKLRLIKRNITGISKIEAKEIQDEDIPAFEAKYLAAKEEWTEFCSIWDQRDQLHLLIGESDSFPNKEWEAMYDRLRSEIIAANGVLLGLKARESSKKTNPDVVSRGPDLEKIPIPSFSGDLLQWIHFRDTFRSMVHDRLNLSRVEKFHYLLAALKGEAAALVSKFPISENSYEQAWHKVVTTYDNPRVLAKLLVHRIIECETSSAKTENQRYEKFLTGVADSIEGFKALKLDDPCEFVLSTLALRALDSETRRQFELSRESKTEIPTTDDVIHFVRQRKLALKMSQDLPEHPSRSCTPSGFKSSPGTRSSYPKKSTTQQKAVSFHTTGDSRDGNLSKSRDASPKADTNPVCLFCNGPHSCARCEDFAKLPLEQRTSKIRVWQVCFNCLRKGHRANKCFSKYRCRLCKKKHHTLVHRENKAKKEIPPTKKEEDSPNDDRTFTGFGSTRPSGSVPTVLLGTARLLISGGKGKFCSAYALLDCGSQHTFVTSSLAEKIGAVISPSKVLITGLSGSALPMHLVKGATECTLRPFAGEKEFRTSPLVVDVITSKLPSVRLPTSVTSKLVDLPLADHKFGEPKSIDILLGADVYRQIITGASTPSDIDGLSLIPTSFGLVIMGSLKDHPSPSHQSFFIDSHHSIEEQMKAFWEIEEPKPVDRTSPEDAYCERFFMETHTRNVDGRFVLRLPFKDGVIVGDNLDIAYRRFYALEGKFRKNPELHQKYSQFMQEYLNLGHMSPARTHSSYLIPHHGVWQEGPHGDKKLRVVFDGSCTSSSGSSLNDALLPGPKLQEDLSNVLINFRLYAVPLCADIVKMYRQVIIHEEDRKFQQILWRNTPNEAIQVMELNTVTYGLQPSAYQALRCVRRLVQIHGKDFPLAANRILKNSCVDDICTGADDLTEALEVQSQLRELLAKGAFALSKWASTEPQLLPAHEERSDSVSIQIDDSTKILGLLWFSSNDSFSYSVRNPQVQPITKRGMLSAVSRIFDPLGLLAPVIFSAKSLLQDVWKAKVDWDEELPDRLQEAWSELTNNWHILSSITIPRYITQPRAIRRLVGFCDASSKGYSALLYLHSENEDREVKVSLIKAKTKVAPLKFTSIPRLELCAALLLARLISSMPQSLASTVACFSDSQVVLCWLNTPVHALKVFEANRVASISQIVPAHRWQHVRSEENPADLASRGCSPQVLKESLLWWSGPTWLQSPASTWIDISDEPCMTMISTASKDKGTNEDWILRFSSYPTLVRTVARILRFMAKIKHSSLPNQDHISAQEFKEAELACARFVQRSLLPQQLFKDPPHIPKEYIQLSPFLDERGILRVGGRLRNAPLHYDSKHPILLPQKSHFASLLVDHIHKTHFHAGASLTLGLLRGKYWIPKARSFIRGRILRCVNCRILKAEPVAPLMAPLPRERFQQFRAFIQVGVDYAGPFMIKESKRRNASLGKAYLCLFVCFASKALHLEVVSSMTTQAFLNALERFIARRGVPNTLWSDHGTNFIGASRFLKDLYSFQSSIGTEVSKNLAPRGINWRLIPPRAPHFGGLWEAGVKSVKGLLSNSLGKQPMTFEELNTALAKIEFLLNSRPLCPLNEDPNDFHFLTPGHFLIGAPLGALPNSTSVAECAIPHLPNWNVIKSQISSIWSRWRKEYLLVLQVRSKWTKNRQNVKSGDLVILIEKRPPLGQWPVGRVTSTYPARDGVTRVVDVLTPCGKTITRAVTSIVPLFIPDSNKDTQSDA